MASLPIDPSGNYHVKFRFAGKQYQRSLPVLNAYSTLPKQNKSLF